MKQAKVWAIAVLCVCLALIGLCVFVNVDNLVGAYGNGPPYHGRTTNMDKWGNPIPFLVVFDAIVGLLVYVGIRWSLRTFKQP